jgi:hypothetical protein
MQNELNALEFSRQLITLNDLDPTYVVLWYAQLEPELKAKFLLAYLCFYHFGTASWICSQNNYWQGMMDAAATKERPRASERRHFRGGQATRAIQDLIDLKLTPLRIVQHWSNGKIKPSALEVIQQVKNHRGFGDWVSFKAADLLERLAIVQVQFTPDDVFNMYESPRLGAELIAAQHDVPMEQACQFAYNHLTAGLKDLLAPPRCERRLNIQEIETCLCKYHSYHKGHYKLGQDVIEVRHAIELYGSLPMSKRLFNAGKSGGLW